jgi:hypothetical protein
MFKTIAVALLRFRPVNKFQAIRMKAICDQMKLFHVFAALRTGIQAQTQTIHRPAQDSTSGRVRQTPVMA